MIFQWPLIGTFAKTNGLLAPALTAARRPIFAKADPTKQPFHHKIGCFEKLPLKIPRHDIQQASADRMFENMILVIPKYSYLARCPMVMGANQTPLISNLLI